MGRLGTGTPLDLVSISQANWPVAVEVVSSSLAAELQKHSDARIPVTPTVAKMMIGIRHFHVYRKRYDGEIRRHPDKRYR
jgi:hypothetical protein